MHLMHRGGALPKPQTLLDFALKNTYLPNISQRRPKISGRELRKTRVGYATGKASGNIAAA
jgi:hypothetical protein